MKRRTRPTPSSFDPAVGLELEMVVADAATARSLPVQHYFPALQELLAAESDATTTDPRKLQSGGCMDSAPSQAPQEREIEPVLLDGRWVAIRTVNGEFGLDNGFNLLEISTRPVRRSEGGLLKLAQIVERGCALVSQALHADDACILNASQHPDCPRDMAWYRQVRVPRPIYRELVEYRGWRHWEGIDAKAQNGANVQIPVVDAVRALNVMIGLAAAHVALFANSPLESGKETGLKETRLTVWPRVFHQSRFSGDALMTRYPPRPFQDLGDYFRWMFRPGTVSRSLPMGRRHDYKVAPTVLLEGDPSLSTFLSVQEWPGRLTDTGERIMLKPDTAHFEHSQIAQFMDARLRYRLKALPPVGELMLAWRRHGGLETLFEAYGAEMYIEGRGPGASFPDSVLLEVAGSEVARSTIMSPIAFQYGLLQRLDDAEALLRRWQWRHLEQLRHRAMRSGVEDVEVRKLCAAALDIALTGLTEVERPLLGYARHVLETGHTAADRLLETWRTCSATSADVRLARVLERHRAVFVVS